MTMLMARFERTRNEHGQIAHRVPCRSCQRKTDIAHPGQGNMPPEVIAKKARQRGWDVDKKGMATCPVCLEAQTKPRKEPTMKVSSASGIITPPETVAVLPPRSPTPTDLRRIMREIDDNWDEAKSLYAGSASDQSIADKLNVPRAWVAEERKRAFGDSQRNEQLDMLVNEGKRLGGEVEKQLLKFITMAAEMETAMTQLKAAIKRLEKIA